MDERPTPEGTRRPGVLAWPITLADGNDWGFALPTPRLRPRIEAGVDALGRPVENVSIEASFGYPAEIRQLVDGLRSACERDDEELRYLALIRLAIALIRRAHDIDPAAAASLLELELEALPRLVESVLSVLIGEPPRKADLDD